MHTPKRIWNIEIFWVHDLWNISKLLFDSWNSNVSFVPLVQRIDEAESYWCRNEKNWKRRRIFIHFVFFWNVSQTIKKIFCKVIELYMHVWRKLFITQALYHKLTKVGSTAWTLKLWPLIKEVYKSRHS